VEENYSVPIYDLWDGFSPDGFQRGLFMILRGYLDESYDGQKTPRMFGLTCTMAQGSEWFWIETAWQKCLEEKNASLKEQGRILIKRYHSADINSFQGDFTDWNGPERQAFCEKLLRVLSRHIGRYDGYLINLQELIEEWPETKSDPKAYAYSFLLKFLMIRIGKGINQGLPGTKITLFHDRCAYDEILLAAFNEMMNDPTFAYKQCFTTIAPMGWEDCIALQPADLIAYENFKEGHRLLPSEKTRDRRKILDALLSIDSFSQRLALLSRGNIRELKGLSDAAKKKQASKRQRIRKFHSHSRTAAKSAAQRDKGKTRRRKSRKKAEEI